MTKTIKLLLATLIATCLSFTLVHADPVKERKEAMKSVKGAMKVVVPMLKGESDYNADSAAKAMMDMNAVAQKFGALFPEDTDMHPETTAAPRIWEEKATFDAGLANFAKVTKAAADAAPQGKASFAGAFGSVGKTCKGCHENFRIKK